jgi:hypothetical protein
MSATRIAYVIAICSLGCTAVLPFDELSGKAPKPSSEYHFDAPSGTTAIDAIGGRPAQLLGDPTPPAFVPNGKRGGGLDFTAGGWMEIPALSASSFPQQGTIAMWIFIRKLPSPEDEWIEFFIADEPGPTETVEAAAPMVTYVTQTGQLFFDRGREPDARRISGPVISINQWHFLAVGWDIPRAAAVMVVRPGGGAASLAHGDFPPGFALKNPDFIVSAWGGAMDELRYFDRMLTDTELAQLE